MNEINSYHAGERFEKHWRDVFDRHAYSHGNSSLPLDWTGVAHPLPAAKYAGEVGPAGGYMDLLKRKTAYEPKGEELSIKGPVIVAAIILAILYSRA